MIFTKSNRSEGESGHSGYKLGPGLIFKFMNAMFIVHLLTMAVTQSGFEL